MTINTLSNTFTITYLSSDTSRRCYTITKYVIRGKYCFTKNDILPILPQFCFGQGQSFQGGNIVDINLTNKTTYYDNIIVVDQLDSGD